MENTEGAKASLALSENIARLVALAVLNGGISDEELVNIFVNHLAAYTHNNDNRSAVLAIIAKRIEELWGLADNEMASRRAWCDKTAN